jgi:nucleotide-binding universal stress UspA family protein
MHLNRIALATDFSPQARRAGEVAIELATRLRVPLLMVAAFQIPIYPLPEGVVIASTPTIADILARLSHDLAVDKAAAIDHGAPMVDTLAVEGPPASEIVRVAKEHACDLIVIGSHGRGGLSRMILGSVADKVMRTAHCPVMIVAH